MPFSEKYIMKLFGRTDIEDVLKRLESLTQEEFLMAAAQHLEITNKINDRVQVIAEGARYIFNELSKIVQLLTRIVGEKTGEATLRAADGVYRIERLWFPNRIHIGRTCSIILTGNQVRKDGSHHQIHLPITILHATPITKEPPPGSLTEGCIRNGKQ